MGKRELLIAIVFVVVGVVAYELTAPPPTPGVEGFSFARIWNNARRGMTGDRAQASFTQKGTVAVSAGLTDVRVDGIRQVRVIGEARSDISYELGIWSTGPDMPTALAYAQQTILKRDDLGSALALSARYPSGGRQTATIVLRLPARLSLVVTGGNGVEASDLAAVHLDNVAGDTTISTVPGALTGTHRNGSLKVRNVGRVKMTLQHSRATFDGLRQGLMLDIRDGECRVTSSTGEIEIDESHSEITVSGHSGSVNVVGSDGRVSLEDPRSGSKIDVRRAEVEVRLSQAVPLTLLTTDDTLRLLLDGPPRVTIDAVASQGRVQAGDFALEAESADQESRLSHAFGNGGPRVSLRNLRADIVIRNARHEIVNKKSK